MSRTRTVTSLAVFSLLAVVASTHADAAPMASQEPARKTVTNAKSLDKRGFDALSDDDVMEVGGKKMSKREIAAQAQALRTARAAEVEGDAFETARAAFAKKQKGESDSENAPVVAKMTELKRGASAEAPAAPSNLRAIATPSAAPAPATAAPELKGMLGQLKPGNAVILFGSSFGSVEGEVRMYGTFPNGFIKLSIDSWGPGGIGVFVPTVSGVLDQQVTLKVVTKSGQYSNYRTAPFTATREIRKMKMSDFATRQCRDAALSVDTCTTIGQSGCSSSVCASHAVKLFGAAAASTDRWAATLKNQWTYDSYGFDGRSVFSPAPTEWINPITLLEMYAIGNPKPTVKVLATGAAPSFEVPWSVPSLWADNYTLNVYVTGPAGTSHI